MYSNAYLVKVPAKLQKNPRMLSRENRAASPGRCSIPREKSQVIWLVPSIKNLKAGNIGYSNWYSSKVPAKLQDVVQDVVQGEPGNIPRGCSVSRRSRFPR
jgi:hypothetical protein